MKGFLYMAFLYVEKITPRSLFKLHIPTSAKFSFILLYLTGADMFWINSVQRRIRIRVSMKYI